MIFPNKYNITTILSLLLMVSSLLSCAVGSDQKGSESSKNLEVSQEEYINRGQTIASKTFEVLSENLQGAMQSGGVPEAIQYCNLRAMPLVDSLSEAYQASIRRTSLKVRNPKDSPTENEMETLTAYAESHQSGSNLLPKIIQDTPDSIHFVAPIMIKPLCLSCHGEVGKSMTAENFNYIRQFYPQDQATGYVLDDFRGMWSIKFSK